MKLVYSIPDKLYYIENFLNYSSYKKLHYDVFKSNLVSLESTKNKWHKDLKYGYTNFVDSTKLDVNYPPLQKIKILLENNLFHKLKIKNYIPLIHSMKNGSGINWHDDSGHLYGITYYINRRWNPMFGGEFLFTDKKSNGFIPLMGNSLVIVKAPLQHKVTPVTGSIIPRKTIQIFIHKEKEKNETKNS
jgi:Rps23 Pro-64 3,4-dihydroxylase Tpa1-like proline 4-hydroxylase